MEIISFRPMTQEDLPLFYEWAKIPHVKETWFQDGYEKPEEVVQKIEGNGYDHPFIVWLEGKPFGYILACDLYAYRTLNPDPAGVFLHEAPGTFCFDLFIADAKTLGQGYGTQIVKAFVQKLLTEFKAKKILIDPQSTNPRAIRCYEKAGFKKIRDVEDGVTKVTILEFERPSKIKIVPYNPEWPKEYLRVEEAVREALGDTLLSIHHVGSTSVPGLDGKDKIDVVAEVENLEFPHRLLETLGCEFRGGFSLPLRKSFDFRSGRFDVNLHIFEKGDPEIELNISFRDYLRKHPKLKAEYAALKHHLVQDGSAHKKSAKLYVGYTVCKHDWIQAIIEKTGFKGTRFVLCMSDSEWEAAKSFRQKYLFDKAPLKDPDTWTFDHPAHKHFAFYKGIEIIGYAHVELCPKKRAAMRIIVLDERARGKKLGQYFMGRIEKWLMLEGYKSLQMVSDPDGHEGREEATSLGKILLGI